MNSTIKVVTVMILAATLSGCAYTKRLSLGSDYVSYEGETMSSRVAKMPSQTTDTLHVRGVFVPKPGAYQPRIDATVTDIEGGGKQVDVYVKTRKIQ